MVSSSPTTTATSAWETRTPTGRLAKPKSWCPAPTADALVSLCSTLLQVLYYAISLMCLLPVSEPRHPTQKWEKLTFHFICMCMLNAKRCFLESVLYNQPYDAAALEKIMISKYNMGPFARLICATVVLIFWSLRTNKLLNSKHVSLLFPSLALISIYLRIKHHFIFIFLSTTFFSVFFLSFLHSFLSDESKI